MEILADQATFRSYLFFWSGQLVSLLGSSIAQFVIIWWITLETGSALYLSLASLVGFAPIVILTPFAGVARAFPDLSEKAGFRRKRRACMNYLTLQLGVSRLAINGDFVFASVVSIVC